jgi:signal transduction histidine kinase
MINLLDNEVKYGPAGQTVTVGLKLAGNALIIWVEDRGPGIPPKERERIWEPFRRSNKARESAVAGTGIGLAVVRELCRLHGGSARVEPGERGGARFVISLPGAKAGSVPAADAEARQDPGDPGAAGQGPTERDIPNAAAVTLIR